MNVCDTMKQQYRLQFCDTFGLYREAEGTLDMELNLSVRIYVSACLAAQIHDCLLTFPSFLKILVIFRCSLCVFLCVCACVFRYV